MVVNKISNVNISSLPSNIPMHKTTFPRSLTAAELAATEPKPGPKLLIAAMTALTDDKKSRPVASIHSTKINEENI